MSQNSFNRSKASRALRQGIISFFFLFLLLSGLQKFAEAQMQSIPGITTFAGNGAAGYSGDGGAAIPVAPLGATVAVKITGSPY